jgi:hypothetical protein
MKTVLFHKANMIALAFGCVVSLSCSTGNLNGQIVKETRNVAAVEGVALAFSGNVYITQGSSQKVEIEAEKSTLEIIETKVDGNTLVLKTKNGHWHDLGKITAYITLPEIDHLSISGSGDMICESGLKTQEIKLEISGSGSMKINNLEAGEISATITGSGDMSITGNSNDQNKMDVSITGSGSFKGAEIPVGEASVTITGSGSATVHALKELETNITGSGSVLYKGNPQVNASATGSGKTRSAN